ncbi:MAG: ATP-dependent DNA helicase RecG [Clostridiales bacterium]|nr:ATP-dependent DNA helicase RecG [Clostridiales bacterium]
MRLDSPLREIKGIGTKTEQAFNAMGVYTVGDILLYFPRDYEHCPEICEIDEVKEGRKNAICVTVIKTPSVNTHSRLKTAVLDVRGDVRKLRLIWFRAPFIRSVVKAGGTYVFYGRVSVKNEQYYMEQPEVMSADAYDELRHGLRPIYSLTKGVSQKLIRKTVANALEDIPLEMEYLPEDIRVRNHLSEYNFALSNMHFPEDELSCITARERFVFDEFFFFILCMQLTKDSAEALENTFSFGDTSFAESLKKQLPYKLTGAQERTIARVQADMRSEKVMQRLIQGDVGSGKTVVAFLAMLDCAHSGYQSAIMAPTDVLARQHYQKMVKMCYDFGLDYPVVLLTGSLTAKERREACAVLENEPSALIIGTHALFQDKVNYKGLALVITDEQHRFGVKQREALSFKGAAPHIMVMSATPIPRTLAIILYGDMDISVIDEVPAKRLPVKNCVVDTSYRKTAYRFMEKEIKVGHQVYIICPLVEETEGSEGENVSDYAERLRGIFPDGIKIGTLHGRMKAEAKNQVMEDFLENKIQILVSTTVVEVGVDVPNATVMMIENAERFGLAQLHQLRGRVGRGDAQSYCILMQGDGSKEKNRRLEILNQSNDGFFIAEEDLKLRGPGDFFGIRQSGDFRFRLADVYQDAEVMSRASYEVGVLMQDDPALADAAHAVLRERLRQYAGDEYALLNL